MCCTTPVCVEYIITSLSFSKCLQEWNVPSLWNETATDNHSSSHQRENLSAFVLGSDTTEACPVCVGNQAEAVKSKDELPPSLVREQAPGAPCRSSRAAHHSTWESWAREGFGTVLAVLPFCSEPPCCEAHCSRERFSEKELTSKIETIRISWVF